MPLLKIEELAILVAAQFREHIFAEHGVTEFERIPSYSIATQNDGAAVARILVIFEDTSDLDDSEILLEGSIQMPSYFGKPSFILIKHEDELFFHLDFSADSTTPSKPVSKKARKRAAQKARR